MTERERLIELLEGENAFSRYMTDDERRAKLADYLLENGVIVPPCKVGDKVYCVNANTIREYTVDYYDIFHDANNLTIKLHLISDNWSDFAFNTEIGKTIFLSREEAEKAKKEREAIEST